MHELVYCSNFGECDFASSKLGFSVDNIACPRCGKLSASPHQVSVSTIGMSQGGAVINASILVERLAGWALPAQVYLEVSDGVDCRPSEKLPVQEPGSFLLEVAEMPPGLSQVYAVLETGDGRVTRAGPRSHLRIESSPFWWVFLILAVLFALVAWAWLYLVPRPLSPTWAFWLGAGAPIVALCVLAFALWRLATREGRTGAVMAGGLDQRDGGN